MDNYKVEGFKKLHYTLSRKLTQLLQDFHANALVKGSKPCLHPDSGTTKCAR